MKLNIQLFAGSCSIETISETVNVDNNQSKFTIPATLTATGSTHNGSGAYMTLQWKLQSGSTWTTISKKTFGINQNSSVSKSWSLTLTHNTDGSLDNVQFRVKWYITDSTNGTSSTKTKTPTQIPRASDITSVTDGTTDYNPVVTWTPKNADYKFKIKFSYSEWSYTTDYITPNTTSETTYNSYTIEHTIFTYAPNDVIINATATLYTYKSDNTLLGEYSKEFQIELNSDIKPTIYPISSGYFNEANAQMIALNWGDFVKNKSQLEFFISVIGRGGAKITQFTATTNNETLIYNVNPPVWNPDHQFETGILKTAGINTISVTAIDSRGRKSTKTGTFTVEDYNPPLITQVGVTRVNASDVEDSEGTYLHYIFKGSITNVGSNAHTFRIGYREKGDTNTYTYKTIENSSYTCNKDERVTDWTLSASKTYEIVFEAIDTFYTTSNPISEMRELETGFDLMSFNASGRAMAIGKVSEATGNQELLEIDLPTEITQDTSITGDLSITGDTTITGDLSVTGSIGDYTKLTSKPTINSVSVTGSLTSNDLGLASAPVSLFSSATGSTGNITLSDSAANYNYLEVYYLYEASDSNYGEYSAKISSPNGKKIALNMLVDSGNLYALYCNYSISGTTMTRGTPSQWRFTTSSGNHTRSTPAGCFAITKVVGYK